MTAPTPPSTNTPPASTSGGTSSPPASGTTKPASPPGNSATPKSDSASPPPAARASGPANPNVALAPSDIVYKVRRTNRSTGISEITELTHKEMLDSGVNTYEILDKVSK